MPETSLEHFDPREVDALEAYVTGYENFVLVTGRSAGISRAKPLAS